MTCNFTSSATRSPSKPVASYKLYQITYDITKPYTLATAQVLVAHQESYNKSASTHQQLGCSRRYIPREVCTSHATPRTNRLRGTEPCVKQRRHGIVHRVNGVYWGAGTPFGTGSGQLRTDFRCAHPFPSRVIASKLYLRVGSERFIHASPTLQEIMGLT